MDTTLTVFLSSKMQELAAERALIYDLLAGRSAGWVKLQAWAYEKDAHASNQTIRELYLNVLEKSRLYIGLFWNLYGEWTIDEFDRATEWHIDRHVYVKNVEAEKRDPRLKNFLDDQAGVNSGLAPVWFATEAELKEKVEHSLEVWLAEQLTPRPGGTSAVFATDPDDVPRQPRRLIGREELQNTIHPHLKNGRRVLLQGFGGMGKTALAATLAAEFIQNGSGPVLWLEIGKEQPDAIFEALARPFNAVQQIAREQGDAKIKTMRALLRQTGVKLLILDNAWDGPALKTVLEAVPNDLPVLVTARHAFPLEVRVDVDELSDAHAVATVAYYAGDDALIHDPATQELCQLLGHLAFALEIAGKQLLSLRLTPANLYQRIQAAPHAMEMPLDFAEKGRVSVADLLEASIAALDEMARGVFMAFGAFFAPQVTPKMLALYFLSEDESEIENALHELVQRGLVECINATDENVTAYRIYDLAYSYLKAQNTDEDRDYALDACLTYAQLYNEPSLENFAALLPELDNLMGAARRVYENGEDSSLNELAWDLYARSRFLDYRGFYVQAVILLSYAFSSAEREGNLYDMGAHLNSLGNAFRDLGEYPRAIEYYNRALGAAQSVKYLGGRAASLTNLGTVYATLGKYEVAIEHLQEALVIHRQVGDKSGEGQALGNLGNAYYALGEYEKAAEFYQQALRIHRQIGNRGGESIFIGNLGNIYRRLGDYEKAIDFYQQALVIHRQIGNKSGEGQSLGNLGVISAELGNREQALTYYQQARGIFVSIGLLHEIEKVDANIARLQS